MYEPEGASQLARELRGQQRSTFGGDTDPAPQIPEVVPARGVQVPVHGGSAQPDDGDAAPRHEPGHDGQARIRELLRGPRPARSSHPMSDPSARFTHDVVAWTAQSDRSRP